MLLKLLIEKASNFLILAGYATGTQYSHHHCWRYFMSFCLLNDIEEFNEDAIKTAISDVVETPTQKQKFNSALSLLKMVATNNIPDLKNGRCIGRCKEYEYKNTELYLCLEKYSLHLKEDKYSEQYISGSKNSLRKFIAFLAENKCFTAENISAELVTKYISRFEHLSQSAIVGNCSDIRCFLRYLYLFEYTKINKSIYLPIIRKPECRRLVHLWTEDEIKQILAFADNEGDMGIRNKAIILLGIRYGIRIGDILNLKFNNINWHSNAISIIQSKTGQPLTLPLLEDVGKAIIAYLSIRPKTDCEHIFLRKNAPFLRLTCFSNVFLRYAQKIGLKPDKYLKVSFHSLRHSIANKMFNNDIPLETVSSVLGHSNIESTHHYLQMDIEGLRKCCIKI